jgi:hypothetical protein
MVKLKNDHCQKGQALLQAMLVTGLISILMLGLATTLNSQQREARAIAEKISTTNIQNLVAQALAREDICLFEFKNPIEKTFDSSNPASIAAADIDTITKIHTLPDLNSQPVIEIEDLVSGIDGKAPGSNSLIIKRISVRDFVSYGITFTANLYVELDASKMVRALNPIVVPLILDVDATTPSATKITSCFVNDGSMIHGRKIFDSVGSSFKFVVPLGVYRVFIDMAGGGGGGGTSNWCVLDPYFLICPPKHNSGGGGSGAWVFGFEIPVEPGDVIPVEVGAGGSGGFQGSSGSSGGRSRFGDCIANGGDGGGGSTWAKAAGEPHGYGGSGGSAGTMIKISSSTSTSSTSKYSKFLPKPPKSKFFFKGYCARAGSNGADGNTYYSGKGGGNAFGAGGFADRRQKSADYVEGEDGAGRGSGGGGAGNAAGNNDDGTNGTSTGGVGAHGFVKVVW